MTFEEKINHITNPEFFQENRKPPHSDHRWYESETEAAANMQMPLWHSLDGTWQFFYAENPSLAPQGFEAIDFSCKDWDHIQVPAHMELQGYGHPQYTDSTYPWDGIEAVRPHEVPLKHNPTGCYVTFFTLPEHDENQTLQLHFEGVETAFHCWLNGTYLGYSEDSYTPAVFDITDKVLPGENKLAVEVYRFSSGSWLEDQDFWRMGGIIREVAVSTLPQIHMNDIDIAVDLEDSYTTGTAQIQLSLLSSKAYSGEMLRWKLFTPVGALLQTGCKAIACDTLDFSLYVPDADLWSAEIPNLYQLLLTIEDSDGRCIESVSQSVGFRKVEIKDAVLFFNGKRLRLNGINRHEFSAEKGRAIGLEEMEWDIRFLKQNNFNAVRTSHYPNNSYWYELCDRYGLYVMDETNLETHGTWQMRDYTYTLPGAFPEWRAACISRAEAMLERDKNHPSVFSWSVGNESWSGQTLYDMSCYFRERDKSRPVHYENCCHDPNWSDTTDFQSHMYASSEMAEAYLQDNPKKPYLLCEYSHAMGNSCGNLFQYEALFDKYPSYCGGFIWDYIDQALYHENPYGETVLAYGGDFGDRPNNSNFCTDGVIYADRTPSPKMAEVKAVYAPYEITPAKNRITVRSLQLFEDGRNYQLRFILKKEQTELASGTFAFEIEPETTKDFPIALPEISEPGEYVLTASLHWTCDNAFAAAGQEICFGQTVFSVPAAKSDSTKISFKNQFEVVDADTVLGICGDGFSLQYDKTTGRLSSYCVNKKELIYDSLNTLLPNFWRAPTDNDEGNKMKIRCRVWKIASLYPEVKDIQFTVEEALATVKVLYQLTENATCEVTHKITSDGILNVRELYTGCENLPELPCVGMTLKLPRSFSQVTWYGLGPDESYVDRKAGAKLDVFSTTPNAELPGYVVPQECGNHVGTRWLTVCDSEGDGIRIEGEAPFEFSALSYTCHELENARHLFELPRPYATVLRLNCLQTGVGGDNSWGAWAKEEFVTASNQTYDFRFTVQPVFHA